jgi:hypothetical protein
MADSGGWAALANSTSHLPALGMGLMGLKEKTGYHEDLVNLSNMRNSISEERMNAAKAAADQRVQAAEAKIPYHLKEFRPSTVDQAQYATAQEFGKVGAEALSPIFQKSKEVAGLSRESTYQDAYTAVKSMYPSLRQEAIDTLSKKIQSGGLSALEQQKAAALLDTLTYDKDGSLVLDQGIFKNTASSIKMAEENSKAAIVEARNENKGKWSEPYALNGAMVQKNDATGEVKQAVSRPPIGPDREGKQDKADEKKKNIAIQRIETEIRSYESKKKQYEAERLKAPKKYDAWYQDAIDKHDAAIEQAHKTKNALMNDEIKHNEINWGGGQQTFQVPAGAQTGTYKGVRAYTTDGKIFFDEKTGKQIS